jgi:hypothetical protein
VPGCVTVSRCPAGGQLWHARVARSAAILSSALWLLLAWLPRPAARHSLGTAESIMPHTSCRVVVPSAASLHPAFQASKVSSTPAATAQHSTAQRSIAKRRKWQRAGPNT